jgi:hypothetical protein
MMSEIIKKVLTDKEVRTAEKITDFSLTGSENFNPWWDAA